MVYWTSYFIFLVKSIKCIFTLNINYIYYKLKHEKHSPSYKLFLINYIILVKLQLEKFNMIQFYVMWEMLMYTNFYYDYSVT